MPTHTAYLLLGSNLNNRQLMLERAAKQIADKAGAVIKTSHIYETAAWGNTNQQAFLNRAIEMETTKNQEELLATLIEIEKDMGRKREEKWGPRLIDIDILFFDHLVLNSSHLIIPHPYLHQRRFTLAPLAEIAGNYIHPVLSKSVSDLLRKCTDVLPVNKFS